MYIALDRAYLVAIWLETLFYGLSLFLPSVHSLLIRIT